ncbi:hypothetical protein EYZ11_005536 [Aspergillus tanneri]|uniref:Uncharacterized protein n=1 Tax=Aspergillus tanneri TaxID=1220188 RepID=A0A4S3JHX2_9EURO|nr:hypothetical protein EYZ11_005536 [Aspergillus tanneri]
MVCRLKKLGQNDTRAHLNWIADNRLAIGLASLWYLSIQRVTALQVFKFRKWT